MGVHMQLSFVLPRALAIFALSSLISFTEASERTLCEVTSDIDKELGKIVYEYDEEQRVITHLYKERYLNGQRLERVELNIGDLIGEGIILHRKDNYITVRMYSHNFDVSSGGVLYLDTLYNGITGERKEYIMESSMNATGPVMTYNKKQFNRMNFIAKRSRVLGVIGVERVEFK